MKITKLRIGVYSLLLVSCAIFAMALNSKFSYEGEFIRHPSYPHLQSNIFPIDSLVPLTNETPNSASKKIKVVSYVSQGCPHCTNYLKNVSQLGEEIHDDYEFIPIYPDSEVSNDYLNEVDPIRPIYSAKDVSIIKEINLVPTLLFLNKENQIIYSRQGPPSSLNKLEKLLELVSKLDKNKV